VTGEHAGCGKLEMDETPPGTLRLYSDVHIDKAVANQLRMHGVDIVRCQDVGMHHARDDEHLQYATDNHRAVVTSDADFLALDKQWRNNGQEHAGIYFVKAELTNRGSAAIGITVQSLLFWHEAIEAGAASNENDVYNLVNYIP
jgi:hypothetical protein